MKKYMFNKSKKKPVKIKMTNEHERKEVYFTGHWIKAHDVLVQKYLYKTYYYVL